MLCLSFRHWWRIFCHSWCHISYHLIILFYRYMRSRFYLYIRAPFYPYIRSASYSHYRSTFYLRSYSQFFPISFPHLIPTSVPFCRSVPHPYLHFNLTLTECLWLQDFNEPTRHFQVKRKLTHSKLRTMNYVMKVKSFSHKKVFTINLVITSSYITSIYITI